MKQINFANKKTVRETFVDRRRNGNDKKRKKGEEGKFKETQTVYKEARSGWKMVGTTAERCQRGKHVN